MMSIDWITFVLLGLGAQLILFGTVAYRELPRGDHDQWLGIVLVVVGILAIALEVSRT